MSRSSTIYNKAVKQNVHNRSSTKFHYKQTIIKTRSSTMWPKQVAHKKDVAWPQTVFHRQTKYQYHQHDNKKTKIYTTNMKHLGSPTTLGDIVSPAKSSTTK